MNQMSTLWITLAVAFIVYGLETEASGCSSTSKNHECRCCVHLNIHELHINNEGCVKLMYLPNVYGISVIFQIDNDVIINETISAKNPPPICADVPWLKKYASVCLDFYNLDVVKSKFVGCVNLKAKLFKFIKQTVHMGCWSLGSSLLSMDNTYESASRVSEWKHSLQVINTEREAKEQQMLATSTDLRAGASGCSCISAKHECGCCAHLEIASLSLNDTGCVNITYLPKEYGLSVTLEIDGYVIINQTVSARNPPPVCAEVPYFKSAASICLDIYDLDVSNHTFSGCVDLEARLYYVLQERIHLGCWKLGSSLLLSDKPYESENRVSEWKQSLQLINKERQKKKQVLETMYKDNY